MGRFSSTIKRHLSLLAIALIFIGMTAPIVNAKNIVSIDNKSTQGTILIQENTFSHNNIVVVETNRWKPDKCMWIAKKEDILLSNIQVVFPFSDLFNAVCHVLVGISDTHCCYIHLTPLTSFFRKDTGELEKILTNLKAASANNEKWAFQVYYFADQGREDKFRSVIAKVLGKSSVKFSEIIPTGYSGGELNLVLSSDKFTYSLQNLQSWAYEDAATKGAFNTIPIEAIE